MRFLILCRFLLLLLLGAGISAVFAQQPVADFSIPASACLQARIPINNTSTLAQTYLWDYCDRDLDAPSFINEAATLSTAVTPLSATVVFQQGTWFGFVCSRDNNSILRLDFGSSLDNTPAIVDLGNLGSVLSQPGNVDFVKEGNLWYGFVANRLSGTVTRLRFDNGLGNLPVVQDLGTIGNMASIVDVEVFHDGTNWLMAASNYANNLLHMVNFGSSLSNNPSGGSVMDVTHALVVNPYGIQVQHANGTWHMLVSSSGGSGIVNLTFQNGMMNQPTAVNLAYSLVGSTDISLDQEGPSFKMYVSTYYGDLHVLDFGNSLSGLPSTAANLGSLGVLNNTYGFFMARSSPGWRGFTINYATRKLYRLTYLTTCAGISQQNDALAKPLDLSFTQAGNYAIDLTAYSATMERSSITRQISISSLPAPDIDFSSANVCAGSNINFLETNLSGNIVSRLWSFDDGQTGTLMNPSHIYSSAGDYIPSLAVTASNGCVNVRTRPIAVYDAPQIDYLLPAATPVPVCTNQTYLLSNTSTYDPASNPAWQWWLNGIMVSSQKDLSIEFVSQGAQDIVLKGLIPGCVSENPKTIPGVLIGPDVQFSASDECLGNTVVFDNTTTGADAGFAWTFGDGASSTQASPSHLYAAASPFQVTLTASNMAGCQNFVTKPVVIYSNPQPAFSAGLPPFSCSNTPTAFQNSTPPLLDSNITTWLWEFGDPQGGTSNSMTPSYTYDASGSYSVSLTASSDAGCSATVSQLVPIAESPVADFTLGPSCLNQQTKFTDLSSGGVQSRLWQMGSVTFTVPNPSYTYTSTGTFAVTLNVVGTNGCASQVTKQVVIPLQPSLDFSSSNLCSGKTATFSSLVTSPADAVAGWSWNFDGNTITGNPADYSFASTGTYNVKMTTTHMSGCKYTLARDVAVTQSPQASFLASPDRGAAPLTVSFSNTSQEATSYLWKFYGATGTETSTAVSPTHTFISLGEYVAELSAATALGCIDSYSAPISVLIPSMDLVLNEFSMVADPPSGNLRPRVTVFNNSNIPVSSGVVTLLMSGNAVINESIPLDLSPGQSTTSTLSFTLSPTQFDLKFLCAEIVMAGDVEPVDNKQCVNFVEEVSIFEPYPNPTSGELKVEWVSREDGNARLVVRDNMGKTAYDWETPARAGLNQAVLDLTFLTSGLYTISVSTGGITYTTRFLRQ